MKHQPLLSCTLLVPPVLFKRVVGYDRLEAILEWLLKKHEWKTSGRQVGERITTRYQNSGQLLQRVAFRAHADSWHRLGLYARVLGVSRCLAFVLLMEEELARPDVGTPPGDRWRSRWQRHYVLYYELVGLHQTDGRIIRRRRYVDNREEANLKRWARHFDECKSLLGPGRGPS